MRGTHSFSKRGLLCGPSLLKRLIPDCEQTGKKLNGDFARESEEWGLPRQHSRWTQFGKSSGQRRRRQRRRRRRAVCRCKFPDALRQQQTLNAFGRRKCKHAVVESCAVSRWSSRTRMERRGGRACSRENHCKEEFGTRCWSKREQRLGPMIACAAGMPGDDLRRRRACAHEIEMMT